MHHYAFFAIGIHAVDSIIAHTHPEWEMDARDEDFIWAFIQNCVEYDYEHGYQPIYTLVIS